MTPKQKEAHLNALYFDSFSEEQAVDNFIYLTNKSRTLLRKLDPIAFNCA